MIVDVVGQCLVVGVDGIVPEFRLVDSERIIVDDPVTERRANDRIESNNKAMPTVTPDPRDDPEQSRLRNRQSA
jgi:hypothetical protein